MEIIIGIISGIITSIGMGGGTILIVALSVLQNIPQKMAQAANLFFFIPTSITAIALNIKNKNINYKVGCSIVIFGIIGSILGAMLSYKIDSRNLKKYFGIFLIIVTLHEIYDYYNLYIKNKNTHTKIKQQKEVD